jgi:DNA end-binding protein Ku
VIVSKEELDELQVASSKVIDIERFVDRDAIRPVFFGAPYYLAPDGKMADETFRVIREAMEATGKVGIGRVVLTSREHPVMLEPEDKGILMVTLRPAEEVRSAEEYFDGISAGKLDEEMVDLATKIIAQKMGRVRSRGTDRRYRYQQALRDLVSAKIKGEKPATPKVTAPSNVINSMDALRKSVDTKSEGSSASNAPGRKSTGSRARAREEADPAYAGRKPHAAAKRKKKRA